MRKPKFKTSNIVNYPILFKNVLKLPFLPFFSNRPVGFLWKHSCKLGEMFIRNVFRFKVSFIVAIFEHKTQAIGMSQHRWCNVQMSFRFLSPTISHFSEIRTSFR